jgi:hypothetical protein
LGLAAGIAVAGPRRGLDRSGSARSRRIESDVALAVGIGGGTCRGYWLDLGLIMFALYLAGCTVGSWLRDWVLSRHTPAA